MVLTKDPVINLIDHTIDSKGLHLHIRVQKVLEDDKLLVCWLVKLSDPFRDEQWAADSLINRYGHLFRNESEAFAFGLCEASSRVLRGKP